MNSPGGFQEKDDVAPQNTVNGHGDDRPTVGQDDLNSLFQPQ